MSTPRVSLVMAVRDGERYVEDAIRSVLAQTMSSLELVVVDDGSKDETPRILAAVADPRVRIVRNEVGVGPARTAFRGMALARGELAGRFDSDDLCHPERLRRQVEELDRRPSLGILGSAAAVIDEDGREHGSWPMPRGELVVRWRSLLESPFVHSTALVRRGLFARLGLAYDPDTAPAEDYDLWTRALALCPGDNLAEPLVSYRRHGGQVSATARARQLELHDRIAGRAIATAIPGWPLSPAGVTNLRRTVVGGDDGRFDPGAGLAAYLDLLDAFCGGRSGVAGLDAVRRDAARQAARALRRSRHVPSPRLLARILRLDPGVLPDGAGAVTRGLARRVRGEPS